MIERPHIKFPFQRDPATGKVQVVEQDTPEHVMSCELVIVHCPVGFRADRPEFGWPFPEMRGAPLNLDALTQALEQFEPRGEANAEQYYDVAEAVAHVSVDVKVRSQDAEGEPGSVELTPQTPGYVYRNPL